jgi:hypothetical protein
VEAGWGGESVPIKFPRGSQVPQAFPNAFPIVPQFYPILFGDRTTSMYITVKERPGEANLCFYFGGGKHI